MLDTDVIFALSGLTATDTLVVCELSRRLCYPVPGLCTFGLWMLNINNNNHPLPDHYFISSPNMITIPDIFWDPFVIQVHDDGHFRTSNFSIFPQWFAEGTYYLLYMHKKPTPENLANDPYALIWHEMLKRDFILEQGSILGGMGQLSTLLADSFVMFRKEFMVKIKVEVISGKYTEEELKELKFCECGMHFLLIALMCVPKSYEGVLLTLTSSQQYFLDIGRNWRETSLMNLTLLCTLLEPWHCQCEYVIHLGFTGLVQLRDGLFHSFVRIQIAKFDLDLIPLIFKYKGSRAKRNLHYTRIGVFVQNKQVCKIIMPKTITILETCSD